jgi:hypothetical protein
MLEESLSYGDLCSMNYAFFTVALELLNSVTNKYKGGVQ